MEISTGHTIPISDLENQTIPENLLEFSQNAPGAQTPQEDEPQLSRGDVLRAQLEALRNRRAGREDDDAASQDSQGSQASKASTVRRALAPLQLEADQPLVLTHDPHMVNISMTSPEEEQQPAAADSRIVSGMTPVDLSTRKSLKDELSWALQVEEEEAMKQMASKVSPEAEVQGTTSTGAVTERKQRSPVKKAVKTGSRHKTRSKSKKGGKSSKEKLGSSSRSRASSPPRQRKDSAPVPKSRPSSVVIASILQSQIP